MKNWAVRERGSRQDAIGALGGQRRDLAMLAVLDLGGASVGARLRAAAGVPRGRGD